MPFSLRSIFGANPDDEDQETDPQVLSQFRRQVEGVRRTVLYDGDVGLYQGWYFELRLKEEMLRCDRYGFSFAVITVKLLDLQSFDLKEEAWQRKAATAAYVTARAVRTVDLTASLGTGEFAVCLVHCTHAGAERAVKRLARTLGSYSCEIGMAVYPEDNLEGRMLVELARGAARPITMSSRRLPAPSRRRVRLGHSATDLVTPH